MSWYGSRVTWAAEPRKTVMCVDEWCMLLLLLARLGRQDRAGHSRARKALSEPGVCIPKKSNQRRRMAPG